MNTTALITMITAWTIIISFAVYFFIKVLRTPMKKESAEEEKKE